MEARHYCTNRYCTRSHFDILVTDQSRSFCFIDFSSESLTNWQWGRGKGILL